MRLQYKGAAVGGVVALLVFLSGDAFRMIYSAYFLYREIDPFVLMFCFSLLSLIFMAGLMLRDWLRSGVKFSCVFTDFRLRPGFIRCVYLYCLINFFTLLSWVSGFWAIKYLLPGAFSSIAASVGAIILPFTQGVRLSVINILLSILVVLSAVFIASAGGGIAVSGAGGYGAGINAGIVLSILCGISIYINTRVSARLGVLKQSPIKVNALRSILVVFCCFGLCLKFDLFSTIEVAWVDVVLLSSFMFLIQVSLQFAIAWLGASLTTIGLSAAPAFAVLIQSVFFKITVDSIVASVIFFNACVLIVLTVEQRKRVSR